MLNTESRVGAFAIWAAIAGLVLHAVWTFFGWPHVQVATRLLLDGEFAAYAARNQILLAGLIGLGGLALAYLLNGWRNRTEARHALERRERRLGGVMASDAASLATACEAAARQIAAKPAGSGTALSNLASALHASDHTVLSATTGDLAQLGAGTATAARNLRAGVRRLGDALLAAKSDDAASNRQVALRAMETALIARASGAIFEALAKRGVTGADLLRVMPLPETADIEQLLGLAGTDSGAKPSRLHTVV
jgi:hypothetical protein